MLIFVAIVLVAIILVTTLIAILVGANISCYSIIICRCQYKLPMDVYILCAD